MSEQAENGVHFEMLPAPCALLSICKTPSPPHTHTQTLTDSLSHTPPCDAQFTYKTSATVNGEAKQANAAQSSV